MQNIEQLRFTITIDRGHTYKESEEDIQDMIKRRLAEEVATYIVDHFDELPLKHSILRNSGRGNDFEIHSLNLNLIGEDELTNLRSIKTDYQKSHIFFR
jgi:hypothetical protein